MSKLAKLRHSIPLRPLLNIYQALINPYLYYGICAWGSAPKTYLNKILLIQKRALRLIYFTDYKQHAVPFFLNSKVFPLSFIYFVCLCSMMWDVANNSAPENIKRAFTIGFLRCTHILPDLLSMMISILNTQGLKKCVVLF